MWFHIVTSPFILPSRFHSVPRQLTEESSSKNITPRFPNPTGPSPSQDPCVSLGAQPGPCHSLESPPRILHVLQQSVDAGEEVRVTTRAQRSHRLHVGVGVSTTSDTGTGTEAACNRSDPAADSVAAPGALVQDAGAAFAAAYRA